MSAQELKQLLEHVEDTCEIVLRSTLPASVGEHDERFAVWAAARAEANCAFAAWGERPGRESYASYRAAEDRADAAEDTLALSAQRAQVAVSRCR